MASAFVAVLAAVAVLLGAATNVAAPSLSANVFITYLDCPDNVNRGTDLRILVDNAPATENAITSSKAFLAVVPLSFSLSPGRHSVYVGNRDCGDDFWFIVLPGRERHFTYMGRNGAVLVDGPMGTLSGSLPSAGFRAFAVYKHLEPRRGMEVSRDGHAQWPLRIDGAAYYGMALPDGEPTLRLCNERIYCLDFDAPRIDSHVKSSRDIVRDVTEADIAAEDVRLSRLKRQGRKNRGTTLQLGAPIVTAMFLDLAARLDKQEATLHREVVAMAIKGIAIEDEPRVFDGIENRMAALVFSVIALESFANEMIEEAYGIRGYRYTPKLKKVESASVTIYAKSKLS